jgi:predicted transcriptional regulator
MNTAKLQPATIDDLFQISLDSSKAKEGYILIYEKSELVDIIGQEKAETIRKSFLKNKTKVQQITNIPELPEFTKNDTFVNECMMFRYVPEDVYRIDNEILIFDNKVVIYSTKPDIELLVIEDEDFAQNQKSLFRTLWEQGQQPALGFKYQPNHSFL